MRKLILAVALTALIFPGAAQAHKVIASIYSSGDTIEGEIGFSNGDMAANTVVEVFDGDGNKLGEVKTDEEGFFIYKPTRHTVHVFRADLGAGHIANARMEVDELPNLGGTGTSSAEAASAPVQPQTTPSEAALSDGQRAMLTELIHREVNPLRREIAAYKEKNNMQTILGGIGYILGLFGIGFYVAARRGNRKPS